MKMVILLRVCVCIIHSGFVYAQLSFSELSMPSGLFPTVLKIIATKSVTFANSNVIHFFLIAKSFVSALSCFS